MPVLKCQNIILLHCWVRHTLKQVNCFVLPQFLFGKVEYNSDNVFTAYILNFSALIKLDNKYTYICYEHLVSHISYLAIGPVNLINYISEQNLLIHSTVEFLILGVLADLQVVPFEGLAHTEKDIYEIFYKLCVL